MSPDIETAFHTSLDRLLRGETTLDACVAAYPEHDERLRDMLVVALDLQALAPLPIDQRAVNRGARLIDDELQRLRARLDRQPEPASAWERLTWWFPRFMPVRMAGLAAAFAIALIAYGGVTLAAVNSGPDSALYGYRLTLEELRIGFATDEEKAYLYLDTAEQRLREIESAAGVGDAGAVARASTAYQEVVRKGVNVLGAVARGPEPDADRTGEVAADYRRRLAEHDTRFNSLSNTAAAAERAPISRARSRVQAGLQDVHSGPILAAAPTAAPDLSPAATAAAPAPVASPSPTPAVVLTAPVSPTPVAPPAAPTPVAVAATPTSQVTPEPTATAPAVPVIDVSGSAVVVTGELLAVTDDSLVVAGISIARGDVAAVDGVPLTARVRAEALVAADGILTLVGLSVVQPAPGASETVADSQPTATPEPSPSPEPSPEASPTPSEGQPTAPAETSPTPDPTPAEGIPAADASPTPAEGEPTATPDPTPGEGTPAADASPTPTPVEGELSATPEATPTPESTPGGGAPPATEGSQAPSEPSPTPTPADGAPSPTPEATPSPEATPPEATPQPTPEPSVTPGSTDSEPTATPEAAPTPDPTPTEGAPPATPEATPSPAEGTPPAGETPPPDASPTPTPVGTEPPAAPEPTPVAEPPAAPEPTPEPPGAPVPPTLEGVLVALDSFTVRAGGIVFSRPLDTPLVLHGPMAPGDVVVVTFEALRAASSYVLVAREVAPVNPPDGPALTRWQGFVDDLALEALTLNGVRLQVAPAAREDEAWASLEVGDLVEVDLSDAAAAEPVATAVRLLGSGAAQSFSNLAGQPQG